MTTLQRPSYPPRLAYAFLFLILATAFAVPASATPSLPGSSIPQFVDPVPALDVIAGQTQLELRMMEFEAQVLPQGMPKTWVWGYLQPGQTTRESYIGPLVVAQRHVPIEVTWVNLLGDAQGSNVAAWVNGTDQTLHWADPLHDQANACAEHSEPGAVPQGECAEHYDGPIPAVAHLHGGEVPPVLDGGPEAWFTSDGRKGPAFYSRDGIAASNHATYRYPNEQEAAPLWFHDHALGVTRLNVHAGLAGAYLLTDPGHPPPADLPAPIPLVLQDRLFDEDGEFAYPSGPPFTSNPSPPFWIPEFFGDTIVVNGKAWPYLEVEPRRYRFLLLNGSNARAYEMYLTTSRRGRGLGPALWQIGTDGGYLDAPVKIDPTAPPVRLRRLVLLPGERADVIVDFAGLKPGTRLVLRNVAASPYPDGDPVDPETTGRILQFRVVEPTGPDESYDPADGAPLRTPMVRLVDPLRGKASVAAQQVRQLTLNEVMGEASEVDDESFPGGPLEALLNNTELPGTDRPDFTPISIGGVTNYYSELPHEGESEVWEIVNMTGDAHPIHLHLVQVQLMNRQRFDTRKYGAAYAAAFPGGEYMPGHGPPLDYDTGNPRALGGNPDITPYLRPNVEPPAANEAGWKDTLVVYPGQVTRFVVRWAPQDLPADTPPAAASYPFHPDGGHGYVWHCHILEHEDNEMMRPLSVIAHPSPRSYVQGEDY